MQGSTGYLVFGGRLLDSAGTDAGGPAAELQKSTSVRCDIEQRFLTLKITYLGGKKTPTNPD